MTSETNATVEELNQWLAVNGDDGDGIVIPVRLLEAARDEIKRWQSEHNSDTDAISLMHQTLNECAAKLSEVTAERDQLKAELEAVREERTADGYLDSKIAELRQKLDDAKDWAAGQCDFDTAAICRDTRDALKKASEDCAILKSRNNALTEKVAELEASKELVDLQVPYLLWRHIDDGMPDEHQEVCFIKRDGTKGFTHFKFGNGWYFKDNVEWWVPVIPDPQALAQEGGE